MRRYNISHAFLLLPPGSYPTELNYLEVYQPYETWSAVTLPKFTLNEKIMPKELKIDAGRTTAPLLLSESDLIATMDRNGIGRFFELDTRN